MITSNKRKACTNTRYYTIGLNLSLTMRYPTHLVDNSNLKLVTVNLEQSERIVISGKIGSIRYLYTVVGNVYSMLVLLARIN